MNRDMNATIANLHPHYTNSVFATPQTVWMAEGRKLGKGGYVKDAEYNYSDRIWQWDWSKASKANEVIDSTINRNSAAYIQEFLRYFFDNPKLTLVHIMASFNQSTGYAYQVFGYLTDDSA